MKREIGNLETADCARCADRVLRKTLVKDENTGKMVCPSCQDYSVKHKFTPQRNVITIWED